MGLLRFFSIVARRHHLAQHSPEPLAAFYAVPLSLDDDYRQTPMVALDLETTGLDSQRDHILSIGLVQLDGGEIDLGSAWHQLVHSPQELREDNVVIHRLTDDNVAAAPPLTQVLPELLQRLGGRVLIAHHAGIELGFIDAACRRLYGQGFYMPTIDTELLARRQAQRQHRVIGPNGLRLANLRAEFGLPRKKSHNALYDALAAAELLQVLAASQAGRKPLPVRRLLKSRMG